MGLQDLVAAWNAQDPQQIAALFAADGMRHQISLPETRLVGREQIAEGVGAILAAFPDAQLDVEAMTVADDGRIVLEWVFSGTHEGDYPGMPASGESVRLPGVSIVRLAPDGAIAEERAYWDTATLLAATGVLAG